jgi:transposase IS166 family protein
MTSASESLPSDLTGAHAMILGERAARVEAERKLVDARTEAANAQADLSSTQALISYLKLEIEKLRRQLYGTGSKRKARLLEQMELQLEELEATATEDELSAEQAAAQTQTVKSFQRRRPSRKPFPAHLPRERVVIPAPESCPCCGYSLSTTAESSSNGARPSIPSIPATCSIPARRKGVSPSIRATPWSRGSIRSARCTCPSARTRSAARPAVVRRRASLSLRSA